MRHIDLRHTCDDDDSDGDDCIPCFAEENPAVQTVCRCAECCRILILEVLLEDAVVEPRIAMECQPLRGFGNEPMGFLLNDQSKSGACHFLDLGTNLCGIYESRPLMCRLFDCYGQDRNELVELGILPIRAQ